MKYLDVISVVESRRTEKNLSKRQLCNAAGITPQYYDLLLKGQASPSVEVVFHLVAAVDFEFKILKRVI